jgi:hypothetical protein
LCRWGGGEAEETPQEGVEIDWLVVLAAPDNVRWKPNSIFFSGPEADLLSMHPGIEGIGMALEGADHELVTEGPVSSGKQREC